MNIVNHIYDDVNISFEIEEDRIEFLKDAKAKAHAFEMPALEEAIAKELEYADRALEKCLVHKKIIEFAIENGFTVD